MSSSAEPPTTNYARVYIGTRELLLVFFRDEDALEATRAQRDLREFAAKGARVVLWRRPRWAFGWGFVDATILEGSSAIRAREVAA